MTDRLYTKWDLRYPLAVALAALGYLLRLVLTHWVGPALPTYITFYPMVMLAALLGGIGPGIVATCTVALITDYWILSPVGSFQIATLHDAVSLAFFSLMGVFMSVVAGLYRRIRGNLEALVAARTRELRDANAALQQQVALIDPARAAIIAREMHRLVRERDARAMAPVPESDVRSHVPLVAGVLVVCAGLLALTGWAFGIETFKRVGPGWVAMKANTAVCFVLAGMALLLRDRKAWRMVLSGIIGGIGILTLIEYVAGVNLGIDQLLVREADPVQTAHAGRMAVATAITFLFVSLTLLLLKTRAQAARLIGQTLALVVAMTGMIVLIGYLYNAPGFYESPGFNNSTNVALHTALLFVALAAGLYFARTDGLASVLMRPGPGAQLARRLLPAVLAGPLVLGRLFDYGVQRGVYSDSTGTAMFTLTMILLLTALILWTAGALYRIDLLRQMKDVQLHNQAELMDRATDALVVRELAGPIRFWNRGAEALYGWPAREVLGKPLHALLYTEGLPPEHEALLEQGGQWEGVLTQTARDGQRIIVESRKTAVRVENGRILILESNRDITARQKAEVEAARLYAELSKYASTIEHANKALEASRHAALNLMEDAIVAREQAEKANREMQLAQEREKESATHLARAQAAANTIRAMHEGVILFEMDGTIISVNPAVERLIGLANETIVGRNIESLLSAYLMGADLETAQRGLATLHKNEIPNLPPLLLKKPNGPTFHVLPSVSLIDAPEGGRRRMAVLTLKNVTELHETSQRLRELAERLALAEEEDRWRISRYIHDTVVQNLSLSNIRLGAMVQNLHNAHRKDDVNALSQIRGLLGQAIDECRMVMSDLTPALLYELGLVSALKDFAQRMEAKHAVRIVIETEGCEPSIANALRGLLFEAARELITNALKHAGSCEIRVTVGCNAHDLILRVSDNGQGIVPSSVPKAAGQQGGFGLLNIRQRMIGLGGRFEIDSEPGKGTTATITVPLREEEAG